MGLYTYFFKQVNGHPTENDLTKDVTVSYKHSIHLYIHVWLFWKEKYAKNNIHNISWRIGEKYTLLRNIEIQ